jgi:hypothetical protein
VNRNDTKSITMRMPPHVHIVTRQQKDLWINVNNGKKQYIEIINNKNTVHK